MAFDGVATLESFCLEPLRPGGPAPLSFLKAMDMTAADYATLFFQIAERHLAKRGRHSFRARISELFCIHKLLWLVEAGVASQRVQLHPGSPQRQVAQEIMALRERCGGPEAAGGGWRREKWITKLNAMLLGEWYARCLDAPGWEALAAARQLRDRCQAQEHSQVKPTLALALLGGFLRAKPRSDESLTVCVQMFFYTWVTAFCREEVREECAQVMSTCRDLANYRRAIGEAMFYDVLRCLAVADLLPKSLKNELAGAEVFFSAGVCEQLRPELWYHCFSAAQRIALCVAAKSATGVNQLFFVMWLLAEYAKAFRQFEATYGAL